jgi:cation diffusion facilitator CzcD-associated flavoprotein CzcO
MDDPNTLEADYVITGAGTTALAFADTLLSESTATMIIVDRRAKPGGHWLDAYPFVRLHGAAAVYGVNTQPLGQGTVDAVGLNQGLNELASGAEICAYFDRLMQQRLLPSGRVTYLSRHEVGADGVAASLVNGRRTQLKARRKWG